MASVPSIGCLLARNQYYRKSSISSVSSLTGSDSVNFIDDDKSQQGLPEVAESTWWFKSFFQSEPVLSNVRVKDLSALAPAVDSDNQDPLPAADIHT
ncbi:pancreatic progenitor cell differentiation and proliferation factor-like protein [Cebus imitator]|uniref:Pancreatic progenitor cell differentiation and proliferation factor-like protein n=1 Tax=Sapajus apella TaxID=9515 RepID=A0A6J3JBY5_SAPAP|nr:pancreatic progenitor cell differentiation and proliferation factor-like protein [Cebus imitator]XP_032151940.1 pancreatic progenitor cell differentiation and proliferation factor-like protein [Sapajus apella]